jgi:rsbT antagonist protein RsbS
MARVPLLGQGRVLIASVPEGLDDSDLLAFQNDLLTTIGHRAATGVVVDLSALDVVDSFTARTLQQVVKAARLRGARGVLIGIRPDVAYAMVRLGLTLDVPAARDLDGALAWLDRQVA